MVIDEDYVRRAEEVLLNEQKVYEGLGPAMVDGNGVAWTIWQLCENAIETSRCAISLLRLDHIWVCDMLIRSVAEGSLKILFILSEAPHIAASRCDEFMIALSDLARLRQHKQLASALTSGLRSDTEEWIKSELLSPEEVTRIEKTYPKHLRREIVARWSFASIAQHLASIDAGFAKLPHLAHTYSLSSQFLHQDSPALLQRWARIAMLTEKRATLDRAQATRQLSDLVAMCLLRLASVGIRLDPEPTDVLTHADLLMRDLRSACMSLAARVSSPTG